jgi:Icc-related predicted phosphoesterase/plastocyanin
MKIDRRGFLKLMGFGGVVFASGLGSLGNQAHAISEEGDFFFVQLSDTHWGFKNPAINPDAADTLKKAIAVINDLNPQPDFIVFTGDLTHTTDDAQERRKRLTEFRDLTRGLKTKNIKFLPGEHDASLDNGAAYQEVFGKSYYSFEHKGIHFIAIDNVSDPTSSIGEKQLQWLSNELQQLGKEERIVVLTHRPFFSLYPQWDWWTQDGDKALDLLKPYKNVMILYGHIHQENHHMDGQIGEHAAMGMMYPLPAPGSVPKKEPVTWDSTVPYKGLGYRVVAVKKTGYTLTEYPVNLKEQVITIMAKKFEYSPAEIRIKKGVPVILELTSLDRLHGFNCPDLHVRTDIYPGKISRQEILAQKTGTFEFFCDVFCGEGHETMTGKIIVED